MIPKKISRKGKGTRIAKITLKKKNKVGKFTLANFKLISSATKLRQCGTGERTDIQISATEQFSEINLHRHSQFIFVKGKRS